MLYSQKIREEELKNKVAADFFAKYDCTDIIKDIDFAVKLKRPANALNFNDEYLLWAEAKAAISDILVMLTQLVLTIGKARTFNKILPPKFLGCFDCEKIAFIPSPDVWYTPESQASAKNVDGRVWMLDMHFNKHILYPGDSVSEGNIGLRLTDWSLFDKTVCGAALKDKDGNVLFGREPNAVECELNEEPSFLLQQYTVK